MTLEHVLRVCQITILLTAINADIALAATLDEVEKIRDLLSIPPENESYNPVYNRYSDIEEYSPDPFEHLNVSPRNHPTFYRSDDTMNSRVRSDYQISDDFRNLKNGPEYHRMIDSVNSMYVPQYHASDNPLNPRNSPELYTPSTNPIIVPEYHTTDNPINPKNVPEYRLTDNPANKQVNYKVPIVNMEELVAKVKESILKDLKNKKEQLRMHSRERHGYHGDEMKKSDTRHRDYNSDEYIEHTPPKNGQYHRPDNKYKTKNNERDRDIKRKEENDEGYDNNEHSEEINNRDEYRNKKEKSNKITKETVTYDYENAYKPEDNVPIEETNKFTPKEEQVEKDDGLLYKKVYLGGGFSKEDNEEDRKERKESIDYNRSNEKDENDKTKRHTQRQSNNEGRSRTTTEYTITDDIYEDDNFTQTTVSQLMKIRTERMNWESREQDYDITRKVAQTMRPRKHRTTRSTPDYYHKQPNVAEKFNFDEPLPLAGREPETNKQYPKIPRIPSRINGKKKYDYDDD